MYYKSYYNVFLNISQKNELEMWSKENHNTKPITSLESGSKFQTLIPKHHTKNISHEKIVESRK